MNVSRKPITAVTIIPMLRRLRSINEIQHGGRYLCCSGAGPSLEVRSLLGLLPPRTNGSDVSGTEESHDEERRAEWDQKFQYRNPGELAADTWQHAADPSANALLGDDALECAAVRGLESPAGLGPTFHPR